MWNDVEHSLPLRSETHDLMASMYVRLDTILRGLNEGSAAAETAAVSMLTEGVEKLRDFLVKHEDELARGSVNGSEKEQGVVARPPSRESPGGRRQEYCHRHDVSKMGGRTLDYPVSTAYALQAEARKSAARAFKKGRSYKRRGKRRRR